MSGPLGFIGRPLDPGQTDLKLILTLRDRRDVRRLPRRPGLASPACAHAGAVGAIVALQVIFFLSPPLVADRRLQLPQLRPDGDRPRAQPVHDDPGARAAQRPDLPAQQLAPAAQSRTARCSRSSASPSSRSASPTAFWVLKVSLMVASLATLRLVWRCAELLGRDPLARHALRRSQPPRPGLGARRRSQRLLHGLLRDARLLPPAAGSRPACRSAPGVPDDRPAAADAAGTRVAVPDPVRAPRCCPSSTALHVRSRPASPVPGPRVRRRLRADRRSRDQGLGRRPPAGHPARRRPPRCGLVGRDGGRGSSSSARRRSTRSASTSPTWPSRARSSRWPACPTSFGTIIGLGGETDRMKTILAGVLVVAALGARPSGRWRTRRWIEASGFVTLVLLVTLSWTLPWYVLWLLPLAALARGAGAAGRGAADQPLPAADLGAQHDGA